MFYVGARWQRRGMGSVLLHTVETLIRQNGREVEELYTDASVTAVPFFLAMGFVVVEERMVQVEGLGFQQFRMKKIL